MRRRHSIADLSVAAIAATVFGVAWFAGLWLVVITMVTVAAVTLVLERRHHRRLPVQLAAVALHVPKGLTGRDQFERVLCARIAATSRGSAAVLARAVTAAERIDDPWRRAPGLERLSGALALLKTGSLPGLHLTDRDRNPLPLVLACVLLATGIVTGQITGNRMALAITLAGAIGVALAALELRERRSLLPNALVSHASVEPVPVRNVVAYLADLAGDCSTAIEGAQRLARQATDASASQRAVTMLEQAKVNTEHIRQCRIHLLRWSATLSSLSAFAAETVR